MYRQLDFNNKDEINAAAKGLLDSPESLEIKTRRQRDFGVKRPFPLLYGRYSLSGYRPPRALEHAQMNRYYGLFQVHDRIFQVRGYDVTNLTLIAGDTGWIIIDPCPTLRLCAPP